MIKCQNINHHKLIHINPQISHDYPYWFASHPTAWFNHPAYNDLKLSIIYSDDYDFEEQLDEALEQVVSDSIPILVNDRVYWDYERIFDKKLLYFSDRMTTGKQFLPPVLHWPRHWVSYAKHYEHQDNKHFTEFFCPVYRGGEGKLLVLESLFEKPGLLNEKNYTLDHTERPCVVPIQKDKTIQGFKSLYKVCYQRYHADINVCTEDGYFNVLTEKTFQNLQHLSPVIFACHHPSNFLKDFGFDFDYNGIDTFEHGISFENIMAIDIEQYVSNNMLTDYFQKHAEQLYEIVHNQASRDLYEKNYERGRHNQSIVNNKDSMHKIFAEKILSQWQNL
jgi:hypothetical protein|tara:strand:- start:318 stop:1322 length:1005 start_codon:yes stop_codon:yes gene_type:complete